MIDTLGEPTSKLADEGAGELIYQGATCRFSFLLFNHGDGEGLLTRSANGQTVDGRDGASFATCLANLSAAGVIKANSAPAP